MHQSEHYLRKCANKDNSGQLLDKRKVLPGRTKICVLQRSYRYGHFQKSDPSQPCLDRIRSSRTVPTNRKTPSAKGQHKLL